MLAAQVAARLGQRRLHAAQRLRPEEAPSQVWADRSLCFSRTANPIRVMERLVAVPVRTQAWRRGIPVGANLATHLSEILPQLRGRRAPPEPVAVVDLVNHQI